MSGLLGLLAQSMSLQRWKNLFLLVPREGVLVVLW